MLAVSNVGKRVTTSAGELEILKSVSFALPAGASLAITGASGSGKSTLLGILAGLDVPTSGKVHYLDGDRLAALHPRWLDWWRVRDGVDPKGTFLNDYLRRLRPS